MIQKIFRLFLTATLPLLLLAIPLGEAFSQEGIASALPRGWVGVVLGDADFRSGVEIRTVLRRSPAYEAGVQDGDRILSVNSENVRTPGKLQELLAGQPIGRTITLEIERDGETFALELRLTPSPPSSEIHRIHLQGYPAPPVELRSLDGEPIEWPRYDDRPLILEFWATWCTVCRQVSRKLEEAQDLHPELFDVLAITAEDASTVQRHLQTRPKRLEIALDPESAAHNAFLVNSFPLIVLVGPDGVVRDAASGLSGLNRILKELLPQEEPSSQDH